ncbi:GGDEF domain-containing protein [Comamonas sp. GB3 AK4-5]|uniref:GGDEF domain-containing protein n=1 Tax=Comamonas sp. GB3 AK4-5 TaxID=3231487 RepID=UPI00351EA14A
MAHTHPLHYWLYGQTDFAPNEEVQAFQHRLLVTIALIAAVSNVVRILIYCLTAWGQPYLHAVTTSWLGFMLLNLAQWGWMRKHPRQLLATGLCTVFLYASNLFVTAWWLPPDPLLSIWLALLVFGSFIMLGHFWGWCCLGLAVGGGFWLLHLHDFSAYPNTLTTLCLAMIANAIAGHIYVGRFYKLYHRLEQHQQELRHLASHDPLTHTLNARAYYEQSNAQLQLCQRLGLPVSVLFVDLDHFKSINDNHGHAMGDHVLHQSSQVLQHCLRDSDLLGRVGGEEFSIFLPNTTLDSAYNVAEHIRAALEKQAIVFLGQSLRVTASIGVSCSPAHCDPPPAMERLQQRADQAMYNAKHAGRNRVACEELMAVQVV